MQRIIALGSALAALAACAEPEGAEKADDAPRPAAQARAATEGGAPPAATEEAPPPRSVAGARWFYKETAGRPMALYGPPNTEGLFAVSCAPDGPNGGTLTISRTLSLPDASTVEMRIETAAGEAVLPATARRDPMPTVRVETAADGRVADLLRAEEGDLVVRIGDGDAFAAPVDPALARVVAACRGA